MKRLLAATFLIAALLGTNFHLPGQAAERATTVDGCKVSDAKGKAPLQVRQPSAKKKSTASTLTLTTNCGDIVISLLGAKAPVTVNSIATLAKAGYYNRTLCHRLTTEGIFVLQCGDPTATGSGSPTGWKGYKDENLPKAGARNYPAGTVAMANSGPRSNGSQFFLVYKDTQLGPNYTIWGKITKGLDLVQRIGEVGAYKLDGQRAYYAPDGYPVQMVEIVRAKTR
jgi:peptidyl-prolyl cis-trans isomerase B (cyclophilin B)|uniref:peptidylprolyl isomerase n=1 Tax=Candidatus Planktophila sp. TaxID=2175601 RepID=UPI004049558F